MYWLGYEQKMYLFWSIFSIGQRKGSLKFPKTQLTTLLAILQDQHRSLRQGRHERASSSGKSMVSNPAQSLVELVFSGRSINVSKWLNGVVVAESGTYQLVLVRVARRCLKSVSPAPSRALSGKQDRDSKTRYCWPRTKFDVKVRLWPDAWITGSGEWSACSVSCRQDQYAHGIKTRQVTCELTEKNGNRVTKTNDKCDAHSKPEETDVSLSNHTRVQLKQLQWFFQECFPEICPKEWQVGSWSSCQCDNGEDCGCTGIQKRQVTTSNFESPISSTEVEWIV